MNPNNKSGKFPTKQNIADNNISNRNTATFSSLPVLTVIEKACMHQRNVCLICLASGKTRLCVNYKALNLLIVVGMLREF